MGDDLVSDPIPTIDRLYKDKDGKIAATRLEGVSGITYGAPKTFSIEELSAMLADGIEEYMQPDPVVVIPTSPDRILPIQVKRQFEALGRWGEFKALLGGDTDASEDWDLATYITKRSDFSKAALLMDLDMDEFFLAASKLTGYNEL